MQARRKQLPDWSSLVEEQSKSGLSKAAFCKQKGVKAAKFYYHQMKLECRVEPSRSLPEVEGCIPALIPIGIKKSEDNELIDNVPIRFIFRNGMECLLPNDITIKRLKDLVEVLMTC